MAAVLPTRRPMVVAAAGVLLFQALVAPAAAEGLKEGVKCLSVNDPVEKACCGDLQCTVQNAKFSKCTPQFDSTGCFAWGAICSDSGDCCGDLECSVELNKKRCRMKDTSPCSEGYTGEDDVLSAVGDDDEDDVDNTTMAPTATTTTAETATTEVVVECGHVGDKCDGIKGRPSCCREGATCTPVAVSGRSPRCRNDEQAEKCFGGLPFTLNGGVTMGPDAADATIDVEVSCGQVPSGAEDSFVWQWRHMDGDAWTTIDGVTGQTALVTLATFGGEVGNFIVNAKVRFEHEGVYLESALQFPLEFGLLSFVPTVQAPETASASCGFKLKAASLPEGALLSDFAFEWECSVSATAVSGSTCGGITSGVTSPVLSVSGGALETGDYTFTVTAIRGGVRSQSESVAVAVQESAGGAVINQIKSPLVSGTRNRVRALMDDPECGNYVSEKWFLVDADGNQEQMTERKLKADGQLVWTPPEADGEHTMKLVLSRDDATTVEVSSNTFELYSGITKGTCSVTSSEVDINDAFDVTCSGYQTALQTELQYKVLYRLKDKAGRRSKFSSWNTSPVARASIPTPGEYEVIVKIRDGKTKVRHVIMVTVTGTVGEVTGDELDNALDNLSDQDLLLHTVVTVGVTGQEIDQAVALLFLAAMSGVLPADMGEASDLLGGMVALGGMNVNNGQAGFNQQLYVSVTTTVQGVLNLPGLINDEGANNAFIAIIMLFGSVRTGGPASRRRLDAEASASDAGSAASLLHSVIAKMEFGPDVVKEVGDMMLYSPGSNVNATFGQCLELDVESAENAVAAGITASGAESYNCGQDVVFLAGQAFGCPANASDCSAGVSTGECEASALNAACVELRASLCGREVPLKDLAVPFVVEVQSTVRPKLEAVLKCMVYHEGSWEKADVSSSQPVDGMVRCSSTRSGTVAAVWTDPEVLVAVEPPESSGAVTPRSASAGALLGVVAAAALALAGGA